MLKEDHGGSKVELFLTLPLQLVVFIRDVRDSVEITA